LPKVQPASRAATEGAGGDGGGFQINLTPLYGITMPIIVRKGQLR
jgi:hypothetical protein